AIAARDQARQAAHAEYDVEPAILLQAIAPLQAPDLGLPALTALRGLLLDTDEGTGIVTRLNALAPRCSELISVLDLLLSDFRQHDLAMIGQVVRDLREEADTLSDLLPLLGELAETPESFAHVIRTFPLTPDQLEAAVARASLEELYRTE